MSRHDSHKNETAKAVALQYGTNDAAPVVVASGMGYMAEKIVETAQDHGVPVYEDNSLATILTQLNLGQEIPESLYQAIVEIYVYFLHFNPDGSPGSVSDSTAPQIDAVPESGDTQKEEDSAENKEQSEIGNDETAEQLP